MAVKQEIEAIYENQVFRPVRAVRNVPDHAIVRLSIEEIRDPGSAAAEGMRRFSAIERLAQAAFAGLSDEEAAALAAARLDQKHFFERPTS